MDVVSLLRTPGHRRALLLRRALAAVLVLAAVFSAAAGHRADPLVAVFARDVEAGTVLREGDVELRRLPAQAIPHNAVTSPDTAVDVLVAAGASAGEVVTPARLVGPELASSLSHDGSGTMVPVALAEPDIIPMLHHGARVGVITVADTGAPQRVAAGGRVVLARPAEQGKDATVLLLLREAEAEAVAAASLNSPLTLVLEGPGSEQNSLLVGETPVIVP